MHGRVGGVYFGPCQAVSIRCDLSWTLFLSMSRTLLLFRHAMDKMFTVLLNAWTGWWSLLCYTSGHCSPIGSITDTLFVHGSRVYTFQTCHGQDIYQCYLTPARTRCFPILKRISGGGHPSRTTTPLIETMSKANL